MPPQPIPMDPKSILDLIVRRRWIIMIPFSLAMIAGIYLSITLPRIYEAETLILIQPQKVPEEYVQSIVTSDPGERINTLSQQILSRTNLEKIIDEFKLYQGPEFDDLYEEDKIAQLRKNITVSVSSDRRSQSDAFTIAYQGKDPQRVMRITNTLASFFIDENLRLREAQAVGTSDFLDDELAAMKKRLETVEETLKTYRENFMGQLPEQLDSNLRILDRLQEQLGENLQALSGAKIRLAALQNEAAAAKEQATTVIINPGEKSDSGDLAQLQVQLENLLSRYTERHPDVVRLKARIADLEAQAAAQADEAGDTADGSPAPASLPPEMRQQFAEINREMQRLESDIAENRRQIAIYNERVENTPKREQELLSLKRDYENIQASYNSLLARKLEAEIAVNMERKQKGEQFRVVDSARLPEKPVKPDMKKLFALVVAAGLAVGGGIVFLLEYLDQTFKRPDQVESDLQLAVLCTVPEIVSPRKQLLRRLEHAGSLMFGVVSVALFGAFAVLYINGVDQTLDLVRQVVNI